MHTCNREGLSSELSWNAHRAVMQGVRRAGVLVGHAV